MKDRLEQFINENREQFDPFEPDEKLWSGIQNNISMQPTVTNWSKILWRAAAVLIIFGASFTLSEFLHQKRSVLVEQEMPELMEAEIYYTGMLNEKLQQLAPLIENQPEIGRTLEQDLSELDSIYTELQKDLRDNIANDEVVEAMIQNYILKIQILEDLLEYMDETSKNHEDENAAFEI